MCMKVPDYLKDMLVRAKLQFEGFDNAEQPQKPHRESVWPFFALCHINQWTLFYTIFQPPSSLSHTQNPRKNSYFNSCPRFKLFWPLKPLTHTHLAILFNNPESNKNLNTYHHISGKVFTSSMCHNSVGWPFQVVDFFCENSKFSLKNFKLPLMVATTSSSIYGRRGRVDRSWSAARWAGRWRSTGQNWRRMTGTTGSDAGQSRWSFFKSRFIVS